MTDADMPKVILAAQRQPLVLALEAYGIDTDRFFKEAGVPNLAAADPLVRIGVPEINCLYKLAIEKTGDPNFGLKVGSYFNFGSWHALGFGLMASSTLTDFCNRLSTYSSFASGITRISTGATGDEYFLIITKRVEGVCFEAVDAVTAGLFHLMRMAYVKPLRPVRVELPRPFPKEKSEDFQHHFGCPTLFDSPTWRIVLRAEDAQIPLVASCKELAQIHDRMVIEYMSKMNKSDVVSQVRSLIQSELPKGNVTQEYVANLANLGLRNMQIKLSKSGTSYLKLLEEARRRLAMSYIEQSRLTITEIAFTLGFKNSANFTRAFRRWTGQSPSEYRRALAH